TAQRNLRPAHEAVVEPAEAAEPEGTARKGADARGHRQRSQRRHTEPRGYRPAQRPAAPGRAGPEYAGGYAAHREVQAAAEERHVEPHARASVLRADRDEDHPGIRQLQRTVELRRGLR